ncbi:MAG: hypothetical protein GXO80_04465 [Chlorobi bacterium]|nr:hypothetical protein [Chlorobiota bacterium]
MELYKKRDFGELIGAPFIFFGKEIKTLLTGIVIFIGPFILSEIVLIRWFGFHPVEDIYTQIQNFQYSFGGTSSFMMIFSVFQNVMLYTFIGSYIKVLHKKGYRNVEINDIWTEIKRFFWPFAGALILGNIIIVIGIIMFVIPGIYIAVALYPLFAIIIFEEIGVKNSLPRSFELIKGNWWLSLGLIIIMFIILTTGTAILTLFFNFLYRTIAAVGSAYFVLTNITNSFLEVVMSIFLISTSFFLYGYLISVKEQPELFNRISEISEEEDSNVKEMKEIDNEEDESIRFVNEDENDRFKPKY